MSYMATAIHRIINIKAQPSLAFAYSYSTIDAWQQVYIPVLQSQDLSSHEKSMEA